MSFELFPRTHIVGIFRGFREGGLEFHADLVLPYQNDFQSKPMHGQFLLVQLETSDEAVLGRIASFSSDGKLSAGSGEEFTIRAVRDGRQIPEDLKEQYLKYRINIRVLGILRLNDKGTLTFVASHRRLPHVGSPVAFPSEEVLQEIAGHNIDGADIGYMALGEYIYAEGDKNIDVLDWMQIRKPDVKVKFPVESLVSRRSFVLARAGFGKSNLNKLLFSKLYEKTPKVKKRGNIEVPVGTIIFDPDGEYFWPDDKGRPGLCDVPALKDQIVVFTNRHIQSNFYQSFVAGGIKLDVRRFTASDVISIALPPERQDQQNVRKLAGLNPTKWRQLVNLIEKNLNDAPLEEIQIILGLEQSQQAEALAARGNMSMIIRMLHDRSSQLMDMLLEALAKGKLCIIDVSQMRGGQAMMLSGLILRRIFDNNQEEFTSATPKTIPTIAVVEEAQSVLNERAAAAAPYIAWVKEGRKYDLGALLITQQPGSIPNEILSQGDNWFIFHLLSASDLINVQKANAHFSEDILSTLLNEPIPGQGVFWSSVGGKPYPIPLRVLSFERLYSALDPNYDRAASDTYASQLKAKFQQAMEQALESVKSEGGKENQSITNIGEAEDPGRNADLLEISKSMAISALKKDTYFLERIKSDEGIAYGVILQKIKEKIPTTFTDQQNTAYSLVPEVLSEIYGSQGEGWHSYKNSTKSNKTYVRLGRGNK